MSSEHKPSELLNAFLEHKNVLAAYIAQRVLRLEDVEDVLQEAFIELELADRRSTIRSPKAYLFIVARNIVSKQLASQTKHRVAQLNEVDALGAEPRCSEPDSQLHYQLKLESLSNAINSLPPQCKKVFVLRKIQGLSHDKIVKELGISKSTVERHITLAMSRLSGEMVKQGYSAPRRKTAISKIKTDRKRR